MMLSAFAQEPVLFKDIVPGSRGNSYQLEPNHVYYPGNRYVLVTEDAFYFYTINTYGKIGFWRSDGSAEGTLALMEAPYSVELADYIAGYQPTLPAVMHQEHVYFVWATDQHGPSIWKSDGTRGGTAFAVKGNDAEYTVPRNLISFRDKLLFTTAKRDRDGILWTSDGTQQGTQEIPFPWIDGYRGHIIFPTLLDEHVYMVINGTVQNGIWKTDGTAAGTRFLHPVDITWLVPACGGIYFFTPGPPPAEQSLWRLDGTTEAVNLLAELEISSGISFPHNFKQAADKLFFLAQSSMDTTTLFVTNGTPEGTVNLKESNVSSMLGSDDKLYLSNTYQNLIKSTTGTTDSLNTIAEINATHIDFLATADTLIYFSANSQETGTELWQSNGTQQGTFPLADINPGAAHALPTDAFFFHDRLFFFANDGVHGKELWTMEEPFNSITGKVFHDKNNNGTQDAEETGLWNQKIQIVPGEVELYTNIRGEFSWAATPNTYTLTVMPTANWQPGNTQATHNITIPGFESASFALQATAELQQSIAVTLTSSAPNRCNTVVNYWLDYTNTGNVLISGQLELMLDSRTGFIESYPTPTSNDNGTLRWNFENLHPTQQQRVLLKLQMPDASSMGDTIKFYSKASIRGTAITTADTLTQSITCSYDPNDKQVTPIGIEDAHLTLKSSWLDYTIRFQNTGNDTAFVVVLKDTLDQHLDLSSFELLSSSHSMQASRQSSSMEFRFDDIKLPDSTTNEPGSHGFIRYRIKAKSDVAENTVVENSAYIYFDQNPPIQTNTTFNTLVTSLPEPEPQPEPEPEPTGISETLPSSVAYPNPTGSDITLESIVTIKQIVVYNAVGEQVLYRVYTQPADAVTISLKTLPAGLYLLEIVDGKHLRRERIIKK